MTDLSTATDTATSAATSITFRQAIACGLLGCLLIGLEVSMGQRLARQRANDESAGKPMTPTSDFGVFHHSAQRFLAGEPLYRAGVQPAPAGERQNRGDAAMGYKYGPLFAMLWMPLAPLSSAVAATLWTLCNLLAILGLGWILCRWMRRYLSLRAPGENGPPLPAPAVWGWTALAGSAFFLQLNIVYGQTNLVFMCLLLWGLDLYVGGRPIRGGMAVGLVAGIRLTPLVFLPYFLWKRQWRASVGMGLGLALAYLLPMAWWGPAEFQRQMLDWRELVAADEALDSAALHPVGKSEKTPTEIEDAYYLRPSRYQSIPPMVLDTFAQDYVPRADERLHPLQGRRNFLKGLLDRRSATLLAYGLAAVFCLACAVLCRRNYVGTDIRHPIEWSLVLTAMLLVSPYTERTHFAALVPALGLILGAALVAAHRWHPEGGSLRAARPWLLGAVLVFLYFNALNPSTMTRDGSEWFKGFHGYVLGAMTLFVGLAVWLQHEHRRRGADRT